MGLLKTAAKVAVASSVHGRVQRRQQERWASQDQVPAAAPAAPVPAPNVAAPPPPNGDLVHQMELLRQLGELRDAGVLTDAEFEAKKAKILTT